MLRPVLFLIAFVFNYFFQINLNNVVLSLLFAHTFSEMILKRKEDVNVMKKRFSSKKKKTSHKKRNKQDKSVTTNNTLDIANIVAFTVLVTMATMYTMLRIMVG